MPRFKLKRKYIMNIKGKGCPKSFIKAIFKAAVHCMAVFLCLYFSYTLSVNSYAFEDENVNRENDFEQQDVFDSDDSAGDELTSDDAGDQNSETENVNTDNIDNLETENLDSIDSDGEDIIDAGSDDVYSAEQNNDILGFESENNDVLSADNYSDEISDNQSLSDNSVSDNTLDNIVSDQSVSQNSNAEVAVSNNSVSLNVVPEEIEEVVEKIVAFEMPDLSGFAKTQFDFILDPQRLIEATNAVRYGGAKFKPGATMFFKNAKSEFDYSDYSDTLEIVNKGNTDINVKLILRFEGAGKYKVSSNPFFSNESEYLYFALVDSYGNVVPVDSCGFAILDVVVSPDEIDNYSVYEFGITGSCNPDADWQKFNNDINISVYWFCEGEEIDFDLDSLENDSVSNNDLLYSSVSVNGAEADSASANSLKNDDMSNQDLADSVDANSVSSNSVSDNSADFGSISDNSVDVNSASENMVESGSASDNAASGDDLESLSSNSAYDDDSESLSSNSADLSEDGSEEDSVADEVTDEDSVSEDDSDQNPTDEDSVYSDSDSVDNGSDDSDISVDESASSNVDLSENDDIVTPVDFE